MRAVSVIIPAAGSSRRFREGAENRLAAKLYAPINGRPLMTYTLAAFDALPQVREVIVAVEPGSLKRFRKEVLAQHRFKKPIVTVPGGRTRAESVWNALKRTSPKTTYVCIHDAARPLIKTRWFQHLLKNLNGADGVVLGQSVVPTVKVFQPGTGKIKRTLDRTQLFEAQTPQIIKKSALLKSYETLGDRAFRATDDAALIEAIGGEMKAVLHSEPNLKVTTYQDLILVRSLMNQNRSLRFGLGFDRHQLVSKRPFYLGGVRIPSPVGPMGHSDGDLLLHAITDAILGAIGAGDIGDFFSDRDKRWRNARSECFVTAALKMAAGKGFRPAQVDATIVLERPKLGTKKKAVQARVAKLLNLSSDNVSIKAKTAEGLGPEGLSLAASCQALVVLTSNE
ncbi:MAG: 2-C-methyl-D-erythritol 4-phosphate cytidylyltransferase [Candidatus Omnitrophica bacterium]|nr:2-C-methyl-D-erythritol 4-phosphate cytidylyltransferase [Candidatus Omnitrophota bacterium]